MSKEGYKKFGDPRFDRKQEPPDYLPVLSKEHEDLNIEIMVLAKFKKLFELKEFYGIKGNDVGDWQSFAMRLAEHCVPAMQFVETKKPKKWNFFTLSALYVLVQNTKEKHPDLNRENLFKRVIKEAQETSLSVIISPRIKWDTVAGHYDRFVATKDFPVLLYPEKDNFPESWKAYEAFLSTDKREFFKVARKHPEMIEAWYFQSIEKIKEK